MVVTSVTALVTAAAASSFVFLTFCWRMRSVNRIQGAALGIWLVCVGFIVLFPNWQEAAEREKDYRQGLGVHFVLKPPAPVAVPCYFVGCITAPASYFHVLVDRRDFYPELICVTALMMVTFVVFRTGKDRSIPNVASRRMRLVAASLIALALPLPWGAPYFPLGSMATYMPTAILHPNHDHISVLIGFPFFFTMYGSATYLVISAVIWASRSLKPGR